MAGINTPVTEEQLLRPLRISSTDRLLVKLEGKGAEEFNLQITAVNGQFPSSTARNQFAERFPERREIGGRFGTAWVVPCTDISATLLIRLWPRDQMVIDPDAKLVLDYLLATVTQQHVSMKRAAEYHEFVANREFIKAWGIPTTGDFAPDFPLRNGHKPMTHQRVAWSNACYSDGYGLFMEQGTGKTLCVIGRIDAECAKMQGRMHRTLIVAPKNVRQNFANEIERFSMGGVKAVVLRGGAIERMRLFFEGLVPSEGQKAVVFICSYECLSLSWDIIGKVEWDLAVLDEAHYIKWPMTKRAIFAFKLRDVAKSRMALTGTPVCNTPIDLYSLFEFLRKGGSGFKSFAAFKRFYGVYQRSDATRGMKRLVGVMNLPFMRERLARMAFVCSKDEALPELPDKTYDVAEVEMTPEQQTMYDTVKDQLYYELKNELDDSSRTMNANNVLTKLLRLAQITSGFLTFDPIKDMETGEILAPKIIDRVDPNPKIETLVELLKEKDPDQKTIVWACWVQDIKTIAARLEDEGIDCVTFYGATGDEERKLAEERFNCDPKCTVFVGNPGCGGTGLNLVGYPWMLSDTDQYTTNADHVIYFSQDWSHPKRSQSEDRAHRKGTRVKVRITDLCVVGTIDEEIRARVTNKRAVALEVQDLRTILSKVLGRDL